jgi:integrase
MALTVPDSKRMFQRKGSQNWYLRLVLPADMGKSKNGKRKVIERTLGTTDKAAAEIAAADEIKKHKTLMLDRRQARVARIVHGAWQPEYAVGIHTLPDGRTLIATDRDLTFSDGTRRPNGGPMIYLTGARLPAAQEFKALDDAWEGKIGEGPVEAARPVVANFKTDDDALLETYITHAGLTDLRAKQARDIWYVFKSVLGKPLAKCDRTDGRKIVAHLETTKHLKSTTLKRYMVPLIATVNLAIKDGKHTGINPFVDCVPNKEDAERRVPFDDNDVKLMKANLHKLSEQDQLLLRFLACTGVRRGEAFAVASEQVEGKCRYVMVGTKTEQSLRRLPLPADLLPFLPKKIARPLFTGRKDNAIKRLGKWMHDIGIDVAHKAPAHSFRHRAQDRLRAAGCPTDIRWELLGHERRTVAAGYGVGSPVPLLKKWLDKVGGP